MRPDHPARASPPDTAIETPAPATITVSLGRLTSSVSRSARRVDIGVGRLDCVGGKGDDLPRGSNDGTAGRLTGGRWVYAPQPSKYSSRERHGTAPRRVRLRPRRT